MYVACLFQVLSNIPKNTRHHESSSERRPLSLALSKYQNNLEELLTWILDAEEKISTFQNDATDFNAAKKNLDEVNNFFSVIWNGENVHRVAEHGNSILSFYDLSKEESNEIKLQLQLLSSRYEQLQTAAMEKQSKSLQNLKEVEEVTFEKFKIWVNDFEKRITQMATQPWSLQERLRQTSVLREEIHSQQTIADAMNNFVTSGKLHEYNS